MPKLMGPDNGWQDMSATHLEGILAAGGAEAMVAATFHDYQDSCADKWAASARTAGVVLNVSCMDAWMAGAVARFGPSTTKHSVDLWLTESALHANSGVDGLTNVFRSSLWYSHSLGQLARSGVGLLSRQTLLGGDYELINRTTGEPNPDFYVALLWHDLVGSDVLNVTMDAACADPAGECAQELRVHAMRGVRGGTVVILINFSEKSAYSLSLGDTLQSGTMWQLRGQPHANQIFLNDEPLEYSGGLPKMEGKAVEALELPPVSVTFAEFRSHH